MHTHARPTTVSRLHDQIDHRRDAHQQCLVQALQIAVDAVSAAHCLPRHLARLALPTHGKTVVIGAGKAAAAMAQTLEQHWQGDISGLVITRYGHALPCKTIEVVQAAHPVPDAAGNRAALRLLDLVSGLHADDLVICLLSGGGSALMSVPAPFLSLEQKQNINRALLKSGASIHEINCVRKHLSAIKGGRLALACAPARLHTFLISDVPGDDPSIIASGPTFPDLSTCDHALRVLDHYRIEISEGIREQLLSGQAETPKTLDLQSLQHSWNVIANAQQALDAAANWLRKSGCEVRILSDRLEGEARKLGRQHAQLVAEVIEQGGNRPVVLLSGGETIVTVQGKGRGGRNSEYLLSLCLHLAGQAGVYALAADTDGIDGSENNAGAVIAPETLMRAGGFGLSAASYLDNNDAYGFFLALDDLLITGPSLTNVNDFRAILILSKGHA